MVSCQKGPTRHAYAWQIGPFWQDTLDMHTTNAMLCSWCIDSNLPQSRPEQVPPHVLDLQEPFSHGVLIRLPDCLTVTKQTVNTLRPIQNVRRFADDVFKCIFLNENVWISLQISLKFVPKVPINNIPALVQILPWRRSGDRQAIIWTNDG